MGIAKLANKDDREEYLKIKKNTIQTIPKTIPKKISKQQSIPRYVATPLPPLNFNHTGKT